MSGQKPKSRQPHVNIGTLGHVDHVDWPGHADCVKSLLSGTARLDGSIPVWDL